MKRVLLPIIQAAITIFLLWWIFRDPEKRSNMAEALKTADYIWLLPGILCVGISCLLQTQRWRLLLAVQDIHLGWWRTLRVYFIGAFFNLFLLGSTGGDIVKIYYAMRETASKKSAAFLSVLVDRMMGLIGLIAVAAVFCSLKLPELLAHPFTRALLGSFTLILAASLGLIVAGFIVDRFHLAHKLPTWLPLHAKIIELASAFSIYARDLRVLAATFGLTVPSHILLFFSFYFAARAFGQFEDSRGILDIFSILPVIMTIASLPVSLSGIGVREGLFQKTFAELFATPESIAVMISMTGFLMVVFWSLIGGLVYLFYRPSGGLHLQEVDEAVEAVEESIEKEA